MRILSIDMDFFSDMLEGEEPEAESWELEFSRYQPVNSKFFVEDYQKVLEKIKTIPVLYLANDHHSIVDICKEPCEIVNLDHHADTWEYNSKRLSVGNWVEYLREQGLLSKYWWKGRETDHFAPLEDVNFITLDDILVWTYDAAFVCLSPEWFPPNLQNYFEAFIKMKHIWLGKPYIPAVYDIKGFDIWSVQNEAKVVPGGIKYRYIDADGAFFIPEKLSDLTFDYKADSYKQGGYRNLQMKQFG